MEPIKRVSPLTAWCERFAAASRATDHFVIREAPFFTQINLRGKNATEATEPARTSFARAVYSIVRLDLPDVANIWTAAGDCSALWLGPDEWLVVAPDGRQDDLVAALRNALQGVHHSITDVSASRTAIEIAGADARLVLAKGCPLDLHGERFKPPQLAQTLLAKAHLIIQCIDACPSFRLWVRNSFARYVAEWLVDAATESAASRSLDSDRIAARLA